MRHVLAALVCFVLASPLSGCGVFDEPEAKRSSEDDSPPLAKAAISDARIARFPRNDPRRRVLEYIQANQLTSWFDAYYRLSSPALRRTYSFKVFTEISAIQNERNLLPVRLFRTQRRGTVAIITTLRRNPEDGSEGFDTYQLVRSGSSWRVDYATWITTGAAFVSRRREQAARR